MRETTQVGQYYLTENNLLGKGSFSKVYLAESPTGKKAAIKKVKKSKKDDVHYRIARSQAKILHGLNSPNICELLGTYEEYNHFYLIQSYYQGKTLAKILSERKKLPVFEAEAIIKSILKAVEYLYHRGIMHRDLKPENIICRANNKVILIDFGFACRFSKSDQPVLTENVGTPIYMSPEILNKLPYNSKSDIWSIGAILYEMLHGFPPYNCKSEQQIIRSINSMHMPRISDKIIDKNIREIISRCLLIDVNQRIQWAQLFEWRKTNTLFNEIIFEKHEFSSVCCSFF